MIVYLKVFSSNSFIHYEVNFMYVFLFSVNRLSLSNETQRQRLLSIHDVICVVSMTNQNVDFYSYAMIKYVHYRCRHLFLFSRCSVGDNTSTYLQIVCHNDEQILRFQHFYRAKMPTT